jgi:hypothetical protein
MPTRGPTAAHEPTRRLYAHSAAPERLGSSPVDDREHLARRHFQPARRPLFRMKPLDTLAVTDLASEVNLRRPPAQDLRLLTPSLPQRLVFADFVIGRRTPLDLDGAVVRQPGRTRHRKTPA